MVIRGSSRGHPITFSLRAGSWTVALDRDTVFAYDGEGRLWSAYLRGRHYRRGLDNRVLEKRREGGRRRRRWLPPAERDELLDRAAALLRRRTADLTLEAPPDEEAHLRRQLARAVAFDAQAAREDAQRYHRIYKPVGILPPDQYLAFVVQITEGCSFNTCTFCGFYKERPFRIKGPDEVRDHIEAALDFLGEGLPLRRTIFLADANALVIPQPRLVELFQIVGEMLPLVGSRGRGSLPRSLASHRFQGIYAFLDGFSGRKKRPQDYARLAAMGLRRVYIGLESGHDPLLSWLRKPGSAEDALEAVHHIKAGGVAVSVIVMLGVGGQRFSRGHVEDTIRIVNAMGLGPGDILYFSEFVDHPTLPYHRLAQEAGIVPLTEEEVEAQRAAMVAGLRFTDGRPRISPYDIREFVY
ncbi:MAG: radical SAM protein [Chloroflexi bacterium]|nr:MAG: radical SAM protein [Chloroflexota bacterium]